MRKMTQEERIRSAASVYNCALNDGYRGNLDPKEHGLIVRKKNGFLVLKDLTEPNIKIYRGKDKIEKRLKQIAKKDDEESARLKDWFEDGDSLY
jgi:hypothetical protein